MVTNELQSRRCCRLGQAQVIVFAVGEGRQLLELTVTWPNPAIDPILLLKKELSGA